MVSPGRGRHLETGFPVAVLVDFNILCYHFCTGMKVIQQLNILFILGKPGAGKTTVLKHLALQAAQGHFDKIPIFVTLKDWADSKDEENDDQYIL